MVARVRHDGDHKDIELLMLATSYSQNVSLKVFVCHWHVQQA